MCAVSDAGHLAVLLAGLVQALVTVDVDQRQLLHSTQTQAVCKRECVRVSVCACAGCKLLFWVFFSLQGYVNKYLVP